MKKQFRLNLWFSVFVLLTMISCGGDDENNNNTRMYLYL